MLQLAAPLGLLALGALVVPIAIHLVRQPRQVVRLGSVRFLDPQRRQVRSLRWREWLLLAVRCALFAALALLLAQPRWLPVRPAPARWLLRVPGTVIDAGARAEWERLRADGYEPHLLAPGFPRLDAILAPEASTPAADVWSLLRELDFRLPTQSQAVAFGPLDIAQFRGDRPELWRVQISWHESGSAPRREPRTHPPVRVALIAAADRADDARYLRAALTATEGVVFTEDVPDWIFQLGDAPLAPAWAELISHGAHLVTDAASGAKPTSVSRAFDAGGATIRLRQRIAAEPGAPVLRDSTGETLVAEERRGEGWHWRFALRFHPDWTDWPHTSAFPAWWGSQLVPAPVAATTLSAAQAAPAFAPVAKPWGPSLGNFGQRDLGPACWLLAVALFLTERLLSRAAQRRSFA